MLGSELYRNSTSWKIRLLGKLLGTFSLHMQLRIKPVIQFLKNCYYDTSKRPLKILDVGCGGGLMALEIKKLAENKEFQYTYTGTDITILKALDQEDDNTKFYQDDCTNFLEEDTEKYDIIFLLDILEHIANPKEVLNLCKEKLYERGVLIISVPTPNFPKTFGKERHLELGHLVDGYFKEDLDEMVGQEAVVYRYTTGLFAKIGCYLSYNKWGKIDRKLDLYKQLALYPFRFIDFINNKKVSCSLFAVYEKQV